LHFQSSAALPPVAAPPSVVAAVAGDDDVIVLGDSEGTGVGAAIVVGHSEVLPAAALVQNGYDACESAAWQATS